MSFQVKVCGLKYPGNIASIKKLPVDYMGFIFYPGSKRYIGDIDSEMIEILPEHIRKIGVFVNEDIEKVKAYGVQFHLDGIQLHGNETKTYCRELHALNYIVIKSFRMVDDFDFSICKAYEEGCHYFLFDTHTNEFGGSGKKFNWNLLEAYDLDVPFFLSGGIDETDAGILRNISHPKFFAVDINSRFEISPGYKDEKKISTFIEQLKS